jgi:hypothetical protein
VRGGRTGEDTGSEDRRALGFKIAGEERDDLEAGVEDTRRGAAGLACAIDAI